MSDTGAVLRSTATRRLWLAALVLAVLTGIAPAKADPLRFRIQPEASEITFRATSRLMNAAGHFGRFSGDVVADPGGPAGARINLTIDAASIETGIEMRDKHLRRATVVGRLTLHGVTREIAVPVDVQITDIALVASGEFIVNRGEYAMNYNSFLNPIGNEVRVAFTFRARVP
jgi:polyisoprenoid-binding protein YceI